MFQTNDPQVDFRTSSGYNFTMPTNRKYPSKKFIKGVATAPDIPKSKTAKVTPDLAYLINEAHRKIKRDKDVQREGMNFSKLTLWAKLEKHVPAVVEECLSVARRRKLMKRKRRPKPAPSGETGVNSERTRNIPNDIT